MSDTMTVGLLAAGAALVGGLLSGVYQHLRDWYSRPRLEIEFRGSEPPYVVQAAWDAGGRRIERVIVRPAVRNKGGRPAINCRVFLIALNEIQSSQMIGTEFDESMSLPWVGWDFKPKTLPPPREIASYLDLVRVRKDMPGWDFTFERPLSNEERLKGYQGTYRFRIVVTADNAEPVFCDIDVDYRNDWHNLRAWRVP
jgi:hypothetical protein